jgi:hypothetical protein
MRETTEIDETGTEIDRDREIEIEIEKNKNKKREMLIKTKNYFQLKFQCPY